LRAGFTLVELLTVIAIISILATLLMTTLSSAKRKAREAVCISNLHQVALALNIYLEDVGKRPPDLQTLVTNKYLADGKTLLCPADRAAWAALAATPAGTATSQPVSYQHPLAWPDDQWNRLLQTPSGPGVVVCGYHDIRQPAGGGPADPSTASLILRGNLDGSVVRREVFGGTLARLTPNSSAPPAAANAPTGSFAASAASQPAADNVPSWTLFSDDPSP
jgi:prepilin-type N-terminal cleavage/methylation domain-containing protein